MRLIIIRSIIFFSLISIVSPVSSANISSPAIKTVHDSEVYKKLATLKIKDIQKLAGRKLTLKEKIGFVILKHKIKRQSKSSQKQGETALIFGIAGLGLFIIGLFVPVLLLGSLIAAIVAVITGSVAKDPSNRKARAGKLLGWITLGLLALLLILAAIVAASWAWI
jgi:hypothetical protein